MYVLTLPRNAPLVQTASSATSTNTAKTSVLPPTSATQPVLFASSKPKTRLTISDAPRPNTETLTLTPVLASQSLFARPTINQPECAHLASCPTISTKELAMRDPTWQQRMSSSILLEWSSRSAAREETTACFSAITISRRPMGMDATLIARLRTAGSVEAGLRQHPIRVSELRFLRFCTSMWLTIITLLWSLRKRSLSKCQLRRMILI